MFFSLVFSFCRALFFSSSSISRDLDLSTSSEEDDCWEELNSTDFNILSIQSKYGVNGYRERSWISAAINSCYIRIIRQHAIGGSNLLVVNYRPVDHIRVSKQTYPVTGRVLLTQAPSWSPGSLTAHWDCSWAERSGLPSASTPLPAATASYQTLAAAYWRGSVTSVPPPPAGTPETMSENMSARKSHAL